MTKEEWAEGSLWPRRRAESGEWNVGEGEGREWGVGEGREWGVGGKG